MRNASDPESVSRWNEAALTWDRVTASKNSPQYHYYRTTDLLVSGLIKENDVHRALEIGCGTAGCSLYVLQNLSSPDLHITCTDLSPQMIEVAQKKARQMGLSSHIDFRVCDASLLPFPDEEFDMVFSRGAVLRYVPNGKSVLKEAFRVLRPGGAVGIDVINKPPKGDEYYLGKLERSEGRTGDRYREFFSEKSFQHAREYIVPCESNLRTELLEMFSGLPDNELGIREKPRYLSEGLLVSSKRTRLYTPSALRRAVETAGFRDIRIFGEGLSLHLRKDDELRAFVDKYRNVFCKAEILLSDKIELKYAAMLFVSGQKSVRSHHSRNSD